MWFGYSKVTYKFLLLWKHFKALPMYTEICKHFKVGVPQTGRGTISQIKGTF